MAPETETSARKSHKPRYRRNPFSSKELRESTPVSPTRFDGFSRFFAPIWAVEREKMPRSRPQPPRPDRRRSIRGSFSWIDHRFLREGFDEGLTRLEKLLYL